MLIQKLLQTENIIWYNNNKIKKGGIFRENIIRSCENCGHCDEDCPVCTEVKQNDSNDKGCIFWAEDTADLGITLADIT